MSNRKYYTAAVAQARRSNSILGSAGRVLNTVGVISDAASDTVTQATNASSGDARRNNTYRSQTMMGAISNYMDALIAHSESVAKNARIKFALRAEADIADTLISVGYSAEAISDAGGAYAFIEGNPYLSKIIKDAEKRSAERAAKRAARRG